MAYSPNGHGTGAGVPRVEVAHAKDLPKPVPAPEAVPTGPVERRQDGTLAGSQAGKALGRLGGKAKARKARLIDSLGLSSVVTETTFGPYRAAAEEFVEHHLGELAKLAGGHVGSGPSTMVSSAALQLAASRWAFDRGAETSDAALFKLGSQFANDSRQNLLASYELATREAKIREQQPEDPKVAAEREAREEAAFEAKRERERAAQRAAEDESDEEPEETAT
ncbi:MAG TPA: hypothetical protein VIJ22_19370 [Polyangiaceae bacterium]